MQFYSGKMKTKRPLLALVLLFTAMATAAGAAERFPWLTDLDEARELAAAERKPMLIVFRCEP